MNRESDRTEEPSKQPAPLTVGLVFGMTSFGSMLISIPWILLPDTFFPFSKVSVIGFSIVSLVRLLLCLLVPLVFFTYTHRMQEERLLGQNPGGGAILLSFLIGSPTALIMVAAHNLIGRFFLVRDFEIAGPAFSFVSEDTSRSVRLLLFFVAFLLPVLLQELYFRGLLYSLLPRKTAGYQRILLTAFLFAVFMLSPVDFVPFFFLGILLGYLRQATNSIICPIVTQIAMLITYTIFSRMLPIQDMSSLDAAVDLDLSFQYPAIAALLISLLAFLPLLAQIRRTSKDAEPFASQPPDAVTVRLREHFGWSFWLGLLFFAAVWVLLLRI